MADEGTRRVHIRLQPRAFQQLMELADTYNVRPSAVISQALARLHNAEIGTRKSSKKRLDSVNGNRPEE